MQAHELADIIQQRAASGEPWLEFLRVPSLSMGLYVLKAGMVDGQQPHTEDEVYYVVSGCGMMRAADEDRTVSAGSIIFVAANVEHRFHTISEDLTVLVFFAPAEYTNKHP
ncbi:MAG: cupin domain-containing protein [Caldilineaceae bacterium]